MGARPTLYQALILFLNRRCTIGCAACSAGAAPGHRKELDAAWLDRFFQSLKRYPSLFSGYLTWTGGEPFLSFDSLSRGITLASQAGYRSEILTGGGWFQPSPGWLDTLKNSGGFSLRISLDAEHQRRVPLEVAAGLIRRATALDIEVNFTLREIPGQEAQHSARHSLAEIKRRLPGFYKKNVTRSRWIHRIPHIPFSSDSAGKTGDRARCRMALRDLVIGEDGLLYPCCGFFSRPGHRKMALGDPLTMPLDSLAGAKENHGFLSPCELCVKEHA